MGGEAVLVRGGADFATAEDSVEAARASTTVAERTQLTHAAARLSRPKTSGDAAEH